MHQGSRGLGGVILEFCLQQVDGDERFEEGVRRVFWGVFKGMPEGKSGGVIPGKVHPRPRDEKMWLVLGTGSCHVDDTS